MEELEEAELSLELTDDEQEELADAEDAPAVSDALEDILSDLEVSMPAAEEAVEEEADETDEVEAAEEEGEGEADEAELDLEETYEIDEAMLRQELAKMMTEDAADAADQFGGGEAEGDVLLDIDEEDLINVLADEIGNTDVPATPPMVAVENKTARKGSLYRKLAAARNENEQYKEAIQNLKNQLVEMNLFNAKLLYANKLMQNTNLSMKQQKAIVEALDNAKTLREAKLLFKSLTESLNRKSSNKLTEGSLRTLGSSSRSTRSAQPASNGVEVDRWGILAGLHSKD
jgi:cobalamin biosynthesis protein CobT